MTLKRNRPTGVTVLAVAVLIFVALHLTRAAQAIQQWDFLSSLPLAAPPLYLVLSGVLWGLAGIPLLAIVWRGGHQAPRSAVWFVGLYVVYYWLEQTFLMTNPLRQDNWSFSVVASLVILVWTYLATHNSNARQFFIGEEQTHE